MGEPDGLRIIDPRPQFFLQREHELVPTHAVPQRQDLQRAAPIARSVVGSGGPWSNRPMPRYVAIVIGSGQARNPLSHKLADEGCTLALAEEVHLGGTCVNTGCRPIKTMV